MKKLSVCVLVLALAASVARGGVINPQLEEAMFHMDDQELVKVLVVLADQAPIRQLDQDLRLNKATLPVRHRTVVTTLQEKASTTQKELLAHLETEKSRGGIAGFTSHWIINAVVVKGTVAAIRELAYRPDVKVVEPDLKMEPIEPVVNKEAVFPGGKDSQSFIAPGVQTIGAVRVWNELGIDGTGTLVANLDSGVDGNHPALASRWRGNTAPAGSAWRDFAGLGSPDFPFDGAGHGTHVMGTITGATPFDTLGVAPGAEWIAANPVASEVAEFDNNIVAAFEWLADPDGNPETHDDVPDVCHNSWGVGPAFGYPECFSDWWEVIDNCEAAGVVVTFSAGNEGPGPATLRSPGDRATSPTNCFTVGSTASVYPHTVSIFSSRGPSLCGGEYAIKPEIMAPGEDIISSIPGGVYTYMSGTSMAGPHVAGVVALMRQAAPNLDVTTIKEILMDTAVEMGPPGDDNDYGHGMVDAFAAVSMVLDNVGSVRGSITDGQTGLPLAEVVIQDLRGQGSTTSQTDGQYVFTILAGQAELQFSKWGYLPATSAFDIPAGGEIAHDLSLEPTPYLDLTGTVYGADNQPLAGATVTVLDTPMEPVVTAADGVYTLNLPAGEGVHYELLAVAPDLAYQLQYIGLSSSQVLDFHLPQLQRDGFESGGFESFAWQQGGTRDWTASDTQAFEGMLSARSGSIGHSATSELSLDYYVNGDGDFSFRYMVDSEPAYDRLRFYLDGNLVDTWSGQVPWSLFTCELFTGWHSFRWEYIKDSEVSVGQDAAWIDLVQLPGTGVQAEAGLNLSDTQLSQVLDAGTTGSSVLVVSNTGAYPLEFSIDLATGDGSPPAWASVDPAQGLVYPGNSLPVNVTFSGSGAPAGSHQATLTVSSNDAAQPEATVLLDLQILPVSAVGDLPRQLALTGAVPNPFNPATHIRFSLPSETSVELKVFDVAGRPVKTLLQQRLAAGHHSVFWDGKNDAGQNVASGVYFGRLATPRAKLIKSMVLVR